MAVVMLGKAPRAAVKTVTTPVRLYDRYPDTGYKYMAYAPGDEVPVEEYERLRVFNAGATKPKPEPKPKAEPEKALEDYTISQLLVKAKAELGLSIKPTTRKADIIALIRSAQAPK